MATRVAKMAFQALILVLLVGFSQCIHNDSPQNVPGSTKGHSDFVSMDKNRMQYNGFLDPKLYAHCNSFIGQFRSVIQKLVNNRRSNANGNKDGSIPQSILVESDEPMSKIKRILDSSVYLRCKKYLNHFKKSSEIFSGNGKREVTSPLTNTAPSSNFGLHRRSENNLVKNTQRRRYSFIHTLQERMVRMLPRDDLDISDVKATLYQRVIHSARRHIVTTWLLMILVFTVVANFLIQTQWFKKILRMASAWSTSGVRMPKQPGETPLLPVEKPRGNARNQKTRNFPLRLQKERSTGRFSPNHGHRREDNAIKVPVPKSFQPSSVTIQERIPVRGQVKSEVEDPEKTRLTLELLGFNLPQNAQYHLPNVVVKDYKDYTWTGVDWPNQETVDQESSVSEEVKAFAERCRKLHQLHPLHK